MKSAIFGGSFDPVHIAHLLVAEEVADRCGYDEILVVPAYRPPHKDREPSASAADRLAMLRLAVAGYARLNVETYELDRQRTSYTIDTVRHLLDSGRVSGRPGLIVGADLVDGFNRWKEADEVARLTELIVVQRPGHEAVRLQRPHTAIDNPALGISSRDIRTRIHDGRPFRPLLPENVARYIESHGLYR